MTLRDIGKELGLSAMMVSLALRDHPRISAATKKRVRAAIRRMKYEPKHISLGIDI
jgi:LacI family transcriptional regulator